MRGNPPSALLSIERLPLCKRIQAYEIEVHALHGVRSVGDKGAHGVPVFFLLRLIFCGIGIVILHLEFRLGETQATKRLVVRHIGFEIFRDIHDIRGSEALGELFP
jgi:hypothetical protein